MINAWAITVLALSLLTISTVTTPHAYAEDWLCTSTASERSGLVIRTCGVGEAPSESLAREKALINAKKEFDALCDSASDCRGHEYQLEPLRTTCDQKSETEYHCYRGLKYTLTDKILDRTKLLELELQELSQETTLRASEYELLAKIATEHAQLQAISRKIENKDYAGEDAEAGPLRLPDPFADPLVFGLVSGIREPGYKLPDYEVPVLLFLEYRFLGFVRIKGGYGIVVTFLDGQGEPDHEATLALPIYVTRKAYFEPGFFWNRRTADFGGRVTETSFQQTGLSGAFGIMLYEYPNGTGGIIEFRLRSNRTNSGPYPSSTGVGLGLGLVWPL